jgi:hypothetical protein
MEVLSGRKILMIVDLLSNLKIDWLLAVSKSGLKMHPLSEVLL